MRNYKEKQAIYVNNCEPINKYFIRESKKLLNTDKLVNVTPQTKVLAF